MLSTSLMSEDDSPRVYMSRWENFSWGMSWGKCRHDHVCLMSSLGVQKANICLMNTWWGGSWQNTTYRREQRVSWESLLLQEFCFMLLFDELMAFSFPRNPDRRSGMPGMREERHWEEKPSGKYCGGWASLVAQR